MNDYDVEPLEIDYTNRCGNCHEFLEKNDKFCRYCGTLRGEGSFAPFRNEVLCIYAPPATTRHKCQKCVTSGQLRPSERMKQFIVPDVRASSKQKLSGNKYTELL